MASDVISLKIESQTGVLDANHNQPDKVTKHPLREITTNHSGGHGSPHTEKRVNFESNIKEDRESSGPAQSEDSLVNRSMALDDWTILECGSCGEFDVLKDKIGVTSPSLQTKKARAHLCVRCKLENTELRVQTLEKQNKQMFEILKALGCLKTEDSTEELQENLVKDAKLNVRKLPINMKFENGNGISENLPPSSPGEGMSLPVGSVHIMSGSPMSVCYPCKIEFEGCTFSSALQAFLYTAGKRSIPRASQTLIVDILTIQPQSQLDKFDLYHAFGASTVQLMEKVLVSKAKTCQEFRSAVLETGNSELMVNGSHIFFEIGDSLKGRNMIGIILKEIRTKLRQKEL